MKDIILYKYSFSPDEVISSRIDGITAKFHELKEAFPDDVVLVIPSSDETLFNCSLQQLYDFRNRLNELIKEKEANE